MAGVVINLLYASLIRNYTIFSLRWGGHNKSSLVINFIIRLIIKFITRLGDVILITLRLVKNCVVPGLGDVNLITLELEITKF